MPKKTNVGIIRRFTGKGGKSRLVAALKAQALISGDASIAMKLANNALTRELHAGTQLIKQGAPDNDIYFILSGAFSIRVNGREIAVRRQGEHLGEIALLDTTAVRSACAYAAESSIVARVPEPAFTRIANKHPEIWRKLATVLGSRLKERNRFHPAARAEPEIFIGSSREGLKIAEHIHRYLLRQPVVPRLWSHGVFECSKTTIENLMRICSEVDFAVLVLTKDDITKSRGNRSASPRDNVIFELGLFMGAIKRERTYILSPRSIDLKIPTDLLGVTCLSYACRRGRTLAQHLQPVLYELRALITKHGPI